MLNQLIVAASETPVRDQPMASAIGCRKMLSDSIVPSPMHETTMPTATMIQP
jgi:hypothetical protein